MQSNRWLRSAKGHSRDLKAAFRHIPINPCDHRLLLFEREGRFFVNVFLPLGLRTAPWIFNLFAEALHWVSETLYKRNSTHYLDDFLFGLPPGTEISKVSAQFDDVFDEFGFSKAAEMDVPRFLSLSDLATPQLQSNGPPTLQTWQIDQSLSS
jgi:hypothetical protein